MESLDLTTESSARGKLWEDAKATKVLRAGSGLQRT